MQPERALPMEPAPCDTTSSAGYQLLVYQLETERWVCPHSLAAMAAAVKGADFYSGGLSTARSTQLDTTAFERPTQTFTTLKYDAALWHASIPATGRATGPNGRLPGGAAAPGRCSRQVRKARR